MVVHLLLLVNQLLAIRHILPFTTTTSAKMLTHRLYSMFGIFVNLCSAPFVIRFAFFYRLYINYITRNNVGDKDYFPIRSFCYTYAFCTCIEDFYVFEYDFICFFSCHGAKIQFCMIIKTMEDYLE